MKSMIAAGLLALTLAGCANQRLAERRQEFADASRACAISHPKVIGGMVAYSTCVNEAAAHLDGGGAANMLVRATRIELAEQVDTRQMSMADASLRFARVIYETSQDSNRTNAANSVAAASIIGAMQRPAPQPYHQQPYVMRTPVQTMCNRTGSFVNCSSY